MNHVLLSSIIIPPNRQRQNFSPEALAELSDSIERLGLLHPIVVRETADGQFALVAGERRLRSVRDLHELGVVIPRCPAGAIPATPINDLDPLAAEEAELDENIRRVDLTWQERTAAIARLHSLRQRQNPTHTTQATAHEVFNNTAQGGGALETVNRAVILSRYLDDPEVAAAKTQKDAFKALKRREETARNTAHAAAIGNTWHYADQHTLIHANCIDWMQNAPASQFDVILTDPPYGMGAHLFGDGAGRLTNNEHHYEDSYDNWLTLMGAFCRLSYRITKPQAHAYVFCDFDRFHELKRMMQDAGWYVFRTPLINTKPGSGRVPLPEHGPRRQYEILLYAIKGDKPVTGIYSDVIESRLEESLTHGAQKPVSLYTDLLKRSVRAGDTVLDCFAGSGTIFPAADGLKVRATGIELNPEYYGMAAKRLAAIKEPADA